MLLDTLREICGSPAVLTEPDRTAQYLVDWRGIFRGDALAVVRPADTAQVAAVVHACSQAGVAMVPQGGNTGLAGGATPGNIGPAIVIALERMNRIRSIDAQGYTISVEAGCVLSDVHEAADKAKRCFPLSLAAKGSAQIGGLVSTNAGGSTVIRYGTMRSLVLGIEAVLSDGRIVDGMRALRKDNAGYDWKQLLIGAEGTLGIITSAVLQLFPQPRTSITALLGVDSPAAAVDAFSTLREALGEMIVACELLPDRAIALRLSQEPALVRPMPEHPWYVLVEVSSSLSGVEERISESLAEYDGVLATSSTQAQMLWEWRESITESEKRAGRSVKHDVSVPISSIPAFLEETTAAINRAHRGCSVLAFGHLGDGNIHYNVLLDPSGAAHSADVNRTVYAIVAKYSGSITAEHGIGRYRVAELAHHRSENELKLMRRVKRALDPSNLMNPGAVIPRLHLKLP